MYGGPQLSQQKQIAYGKSKFTHGKSKSLTVKANRSRQKQIHARQKQIAHGKSKFAHDIKKQMNSMRYLYPTEYTNLVWSLFIFIGNFTVVNVQYNIDRDQKKAVSTTFIRN